MARQETSSTILCINRQAEGVRLRAAAAAQLIFERLNLKDSDFPTIEEIIIASFSIPLYTRESGRKVDGGLNSISRDTDGRITEEPRRRS